MKKTSQKVLFLGLGLGHKNFDFLKFFKIEHMYLFQHALNRDWYFIVSIIMIITRNVAFLLYVGHFKLFNPWRVIHNTGAADGYGSIPHVFNIGMVIVEGVAHCHFGINLTTLKENYQIVADIIITKKWLTNWFMFFSLRELGLL